MEVVLVEFIESCQKVKLTDDEKKERHRKACRKYYQKNKNKLMKKSLQNYYKRKLKTEGDKIFMNTLI